MDAVKRRNMIKDSVFKTRVAEYFYYKANAVLLEANPVVNELDFAKALFAGSVKEEDMSRIVAYNTTIGNSIDNGSDILESDIEYAVITESRFTMLANAYKAMGVI
jgi:hypothetical protein